MNSSQAWTGFVATVVIAAVLGLITFTEPGRIEAAQAEQRRADIAAATDLYAENCVLCHGAAGEGVVAMPPLDSDGLREMDTDELAAIIAEGRYNTAMAAWSQDAGGIFTDMEIRQIATLIQAGNWGIVANRVDALGLNPPTAVQVEVSEEMLVSVASLPGGEQLSGGLTLYAANCAACHGANAEGTTIAPALNSEELRTRLDDAGLSRLIQEGVPGTLMAGWNMALDGEQIASLVALIRRWPELETAGIQLPTVVAAAAPPSAEQIAAGQQLFSIACKACHGANALGTRMAPALNNQVFLAETPDAAIQAIIANGVPGTAMPAWGGRLTEADLIALTAWLRSLESTAPALGTAP